MRHAAASPYRVLGLSTFLFLIVVHAGACSGDDAPSGTSAGDAAASETSITTSAESGSFSCASPKTLCGDACADLNKDRNHCGQCGKPCGDSEVCSAGACVLACGGGTTKCGDACVDLETSTAHCGGCDDACGKGYVCSDGACLVACGPGYETCKPGQGFDAGIDDAAANDASADGSADASTDAGTAFGYCAKLASERANCGACGKSCATEEICVAGTCKPGCAVDVPVVDTFSGGMLGCGGAVAFADRDTLCKTGYAACTAAQWVALRGGAKPSANYWTEDLLHYAGASNSCSVSTSVGTDCGASTPMRVCASPDDAFGNACNWVNCGLDTAAPNEFFGGCSGNLTAGTLCCPQ